MHIHPLVTDTATLADLCTRWAKADFITVDTEFMRENTFFPELCLIQVADVNEAAAIDPMAPGLDLAPLLQLMVANEDVLKVFHAGGQDLEIIYNLTGTTPHPLFDTQVAAMALGQGEQIGYSNLVDSWLGVQIDKGARFTDWGKRPLEARQIEYAIGDVTHLAAIFPKMLARLKKTGRGDWLDQEMERLADPANYANDPEQAWKRVRVPSRKADVLGRLKAIARWRELEARGKDLPPRADHEGRDARRSRRPCAAQAGGAAKVRGLSAGWASNEIGARLMAAIAGAEPLPDDEMPPREDRKPGLGKEGALVADLLKLLLKIRARDIDVASKLLARSEELELLAAGQRHGLAMLEGWRFDQFGRDAVDLVEGRLAFAVLDGKLKMTRSLAVEEMA
jgi:ribonuclease D